MKERLSPSASLLEVLGHLQREIHRVLNDTSSHVRDRLNTYNQLMTRSAIIMKKAKDMFYDTPEPTYQIKEEKSQSEGDDTDGEEWADAEDTLAGASDSEGWSDAEGVPMEQAFPKPMLEPIPKTMEKEIIRSVPKSYRENTKKLYRLLKKREKSHKQSGVRFTKEGSLIIGKKALKPNELTHLLAHAVRPHGVRRAAVLEKKGIHTPIKKRFFDVVKKFNPKMRYIRNKKVKSDDIEQHSSDEQEGSGRLSTIKWSTRL